MKVATYVLLWPTRFVSKVHSYVKMCIATGGGMVTQASNWGRMQTGLVVWLDMEVRGVPLLRETLVRAVSCYLSVVVAGIGLSYCGLFSLRTLKP